MCAVVLILELVCRAIKERDVAIYRDAGEKCPAGFFLAAYLDGFGSAGFENNQLSIFLFSYVISFDFSHCYKKTTD